MNIFNYFFIGIKSVLTSPIYLLKYFLIGSITIISIFPYYVIIGLKFLLFSKKTNEEYKKLEKKLIPTTILTLSITTYLISVFILSQWFVQNQRTKNFTDSLSNTTIIKNETIENETLNDVTNEYDDTTKDYPEKDSTNISNNQNNDSNNQISSQVTNKIDTNFINVNLTYYIQKNPETVAWLQINGTKINYPVVQHSDNDFYLEHDFYKRKTQNGWIFGDYRNDFETFNNNTIIYGHNLINGTMFGTLPKLLNKNWFLNKNNHYIKLSTKNTNTIWQIFSIYKISPTTDYLQTRFNSTSVYQDFLNLLKTRSEYNFNQDISYTDKIITLSTCDNTGTKRVAIHAKLINIESK